MIDSTNYKKALETELITLTEELGKLGFHNPEVKEDWVPLPTEAISTEADENVVADRSEDWQENRGTVDVLETRYNNVTRALAKIATDTYGSCEICSEEIEGDRLDANPAARTCKTHLEDEANLPL